MMDCNDSGACGFSVTAQTEFLAAADCPDRPNSLVGYLNVFASLLSLLFPRVG